MTHQVKRLNTAGMVIVSHDGQSFPTLYDDKEERILFDNILDGRFGHLENRMVFINFS